MKREDYDELKHKDALIKTSFAGLSYQDMVLMVDANLDAYQKACRKLMDRKRISRMINPI